MQLLVDAFNPVTLDALMCKSHVSVAHDGSLFDCDFNLALNTPLGGKSTARSIHDLASLSDLGNTPVTTGSHCFGCTAGSGSS